MAEKTSAKEQATGCAGGGDLTEVDLDRQSADLRGCARMHMGVEVVEWLVQLVGVIADMWADLDDTPAGGDEEVVVSRHAIGAGRAGTGHETDRCQRCHDGEPDERLPALAPECT
jgi:hypothetical protein